MFTIIFLLFSSIPQGFRTRVALHAEILALRHQRINSWFSRDPAVVIAFVWRVLIDRCGFGSHVFGAAGDALWRIVNPGTVIAWHRQGFRLYWRWKSRHPVGRLSVSCGFIDLIRKMSLANPRW